MQYKLLKDLPFAKAGMNLRIDEEHLLVDPEDFYLVGLKAKGKHQMLTGLIIGHIDDIPTLVIDGWIEEIKPREWYEVETQDSFGHWQLYTGGRYYTEEVAREVACSLPQNARFIKVREVIE